MTSEPRVGRKRRVVFAVLAAVLTAVILLASWLTYLNFAASSPSWEGGQWSNPQTVNFGWPQPVEFQGKLYMFYSAITKDTHSYVGDAIQPGEYFLYDAFYRTFDGQNFSDTVAVSDPADEVSTEGNFFVYEGKLYALLTEKWIANYTSYEWTSQVKMKWFDGATWQEAPSPLSQNVTYYGLRVLVIGDTVWLTWHNFSPNGFSFKTFDDATWSTTRNATLPTSAPEYPSYAVIDGKLWVTWENRTIDTGPPNFHTHQDVYVGNFDGENWNNVSELNPPDDNATNLWPFMAGFQGERFVFWESEYFRPSALAMRRVNSDGSLCDFSAVNPTGDYSSGSSGASVYNGRLYVFWNSGYHGRVRSFDGTTWSSVHRLNDMAVEHAFVYAGKLWVYSSQGTSEGDWTMLRSYVVKS